MKHAAIYNRIYYPLVNRPNLISFAFSRGTLIVEDARKTSYFYIVISGIAKVLRQQESFRNLERVSSYGDLNRCSYADAMIGISGRQKMLKKTCQKIGSKSYSCDKLILPELTIGRTNSFRRLKEEPVKMPEIVVNCSEDDKEQTELRKNNGKNQRRSCSSPMIKTKLSCQEGLALKLNELDDWPHECVLPLAPILSIEETQISSAIITGKRRPGKYREASFERNNADMARKSYVWVHLDTLKEGDIFDTLNPKVTADTPKTCLVSEGAELVRISKRYYLEHAKNMTLQHIPEHSAMQLLEKNDEWTKYRARVIRSQVDQVERRRCTKLPRFVTTLL
ncbi:hypothetical protein Ciccas_012428 [Cichlidogyrus casuarinus]|uniref:Cyclic nucleotide-binding domain-containing protein n=1 Tax=Cichlidogyrus casuarinus TaxID=1844966 RepID=A0ABD2PNI0_9PLAT